MRPERSSLLEWIHASLHEGIDAEGSRLSFSQCFGVPLGLALRQREARRGVKAAVRPNARVQWANENEALFLPKDDDFDLLLLLDALSNRLFQIARRPLTAKELLAALPITNKERLRWTKDGRLVQQGSLSMRRGQSISMTTYAISAVQTLLDDPEEIERWRAQDSWFAR